MLLLFGLFVLKKETNAYFVVFLVFAGIRERKYRFPKSLQSPSIYRLREHSRYQELGDAEESGLECGRIWLSSQIGSTESELIFLGAGFGG